MAKKIIMHIATFWQFNRQKCYQLMNHISTIKILKPNEE